LRISELTLSHAHDVTMQITNSSSSRNIRQKMKILRLLSYLVPQKMITVFTPRFSLNESNSRRTLGPLTLQTPKAIIVVVGTLAVDGWAVPMYQSLYCYMMVRCSAFFIARQHTDARYWYSKSVRLSVRPTVCLSVRLSVTFRYQMKTA